MPQERDLLLKVVRHDSWTQLVVTKTQPAGDAVADVAEAFADSPGERIGSRASKRFPSRRPHAGRCTLSYQ